MFTETDWNPFKFIIFIVLKAATPPPLPLEEKMIQIEQSEILVLSSWLAFVGIVYAYLELRVTRLKNNKKKATD